MTTTDDKELIARIQAGDTAAYRETMKRYGTPIFTLIRRIVGSREDAEELTQDVFPESVRPDRPLPRGKFFFDLALPDRLQLRRFQIPETETGNAVCG